MTALSDTLSAVHPDTAETTRVAPLASPAPAAAPMRLENLPDRALSAAVLVARQEGLTARRDAARTQAVQFGFTPSDLWNLDAWLAGQLATLFASTEPSSVPDGVHPDILPRLTLAFAAYPATFEIDDFDLSAGLALFSQVRSPALPATLEGLAALAALLAEATCTHPEDTSFEQHRAAIRTIARRAREIAHRRRRGPIPESLAEHLGADLMGSFRSLRD